MLGILKSHGPCISEEEKVGESILRAIRTPSAGALYRPEDHVKCHNCFSYNTSSYNTNLQLPEIPLLAFT